MQCQDVETVPILSRALEDGNRVFRNDDAEEIRRTWPDSALERVWESVSKLIGLGDKGVEDAEKN